MYDGFGELSGCAGVKQNGLSTTVIKTNQLLMNKAEVAVYYEIPTKLSTQGEHHVEFLKCLNLLVRKETARL